MKVTGNAERIYKEGTRKLTLKTSLYEIHLRPTVIFYNSLAVPIFIGSSENSTSEIQVHPGENCILSTVEPGTSYVNMTVNI